VGTKEKKAKRKRCGRPESAKNGLAAAAAAAA